MRNSGVWWRGILVMAAVGALGVPLIGADKNDKKPAAKAVPSKPAPPSAEYKAERRTFLQKIRSKLPADRVAAFRELADAPGREAAELLYQTTLDGAPKEVQQAATDVLIGWSKQPGVPTLLVDLMAQGTRNSGMSWRTASTLRAVGGTEDSEVQDQLVAYLDELLGTPLMDQLLLHTLADEIGAKPSPEGLRTLIVLSRAKFFRKNFGYRRCVMQGMIEVPGDDTITALIDILPQLKGQVQYDVVTHLMRLTGQTFGDDAGSWKGWWVEQNRKLPLKRELVHGPNYQPTGQYYGIPIGAKRVVFCLDVSGSMLERGKIHAAKKALYDAIAGLTPDVFFGVIAFAGQTYAWQGELMQANERNKQNALQMAMQQETRGGGTASYDALEACFALDPEAIYFVSDGAPRGGKISVPEEIVATIARINRLRRVSVHAIGIGTGDAEAAQLARFMKALAAADWGEYRSVD